MKPPTTVYKVLVITSNIIIQVMYSSLLFCATDRQQPRLLRGHPIMKLEAINITLSFLTRLVSSTHYSQVSLVILICTCFISNTKKQSVDSTMNHLYDYDFKHSLPDNNNHVLQRTRILRHKDASSHDQKLCDQDEIASLVHFKPQLPPDHIELQDASQCKY